MAAEIAASDVERAAEEGRHDRRVMASCILQQNHYATTAPPIPEQLRAEVP